MEEVIILLDDNKEGKLNLEIDHQQFGFMEISIDEEILTVSHTEVIPEGQGKGYAGKLFNALVAYARKEHLKIRPECKYVKSQFERHPEQFGDVWLSF